MGIVSLFGSVLLLLLTLSGLFLVVASAEFGRRLVKNAAAIFVTAVLGIMLIQFCFAMMMHLDTGSILAFWMVSALAYLYCERNRFRKQPHRQPATSVERERVDDGRVVIEPPTRKSEE
jgi:hypothetical protein